MATARSKPPTRRPPPDVTAPRRPPPPPRRASGESQQLAAVRGHAEATREILAPTPATGTPITGAGLRRQAFVWLEAAEREPTERNLRLAFRALRELLESMIGRG